jgi:hypothetical protein
VSKPFEEKEGMGGVQWAVAGCYVESRLYYAGFRQWKYLPTV